MGQRFHRLAHSFSILVDFIFPPVCLICGDRLAPSQRFVCDGCWNGFTPLQQPLLPIEMTNLLQEEEKYFTHSFALYDYSADIQHLIHMMKYKSMPGIAARFGREIGAALARCDQLRDVDAILAIPLHPLRLRERGYNQAELMAREISRVMARPLLAGVVRRRRYTQQQAKFAKSERARNVRDAFQLLGPEGVQDKNIILVDDVLTTGSTMNACARTLQAGGVRTLTAVTIVRI
ncbi:ComF family protein [candidate division KSB1 bacterium]|nr:ComF family protein [candidate division KSB1 bacterium]